MKLQLCFLLLAVTIPYVVTFQQGSKYQQPPTPLSSSSSTSCTEDKARLEKCRKALPTAIRFDPPHKFKEVEAAYKEFQECMGLSNCSKVKLHLQIIAARFLASEKISSIWDCLGNNVLETTAIACGGMFTKCHLEEIRKQSTCTESQITLFKEAMDASHDYMTLRRHLIQKTSHMQ